MPNLNFIENGWLDSSQNNNIKHVQHIKSPNYNQRPENCEISLIVIHNICLPPEQFQNSEFGYINQFFTNCLEPHIHPYFETIHNIEVSSHFLIERQGNIIQYVSTNDRAWHAGKSSFNGIENCNDYSIGIELEGSDNTEFTQNQYDTLINLIKAIKNQYPSIKHITGHSNIAPERKTDPGLYFYWENLKDKINDVEIFVS
jgi:AmpD protein